MRLYRISAQTGIAKKKKRMIKSEREREKGLLRYAGFVCHIVVYNVEQLSRHAYHQCLLQNQDEVVSDNRHFLIKQRWK